MNRVYMLIVMIAAVTSCASPPAKPTQFQLEDEDKYAPVNLDIYAGEYVTGQMSNIVSYMQDSFIKSNLFADVQTGFKRWPLTVHVRYGISGDMNAGEFMGTMVSAATLLVVPAPMKEQHNLEVQIFAGSNLINTFEYSEEVSVVMSLYHNPEEDRKNGVKVLLDRFFADLEQKKPIPTIREIKQKNVAERNREGQL